MMRVLLSGIMLFLSFFARAREIELLGTYGASFIGGESIEFVGKDSFYFGGFYCTWGQSALGDSSGYVKMAISKNDFPVTIKASAVGLITYEVMLTQASNYSIRMFAHEDPAVFKKLDQGEVFVYEIRELSEEVLVMRRPVGRGRYYEYKKRRSQSIIRN